MGRKDLLRGIHLMEALARHYPDWKAPSADGQVVIWPAEPDELVRQTLANLKHLSSADSVRIQNIPLPQVRRRMREFVGHRDAAQPLIANGHQTELYHAGVWAKEAMIHALALKSNGQAFHIAVNTDAPKHLNLRWPPGESIAITDDARLTSAAWVGQLSPPTPAHLDSVVRQYETQSKSWTFQPVLNQILDSLRRLSLESPDLPNSLTNALHELDWSLGLRNHALLASPIWMCDAFLVFIHDLIARADSTAVQYNRALEIYRNAEGIRSIMRPMPDLFVGSDEAVEIPIWFDDLNSGKRSRPSAFRTDRGWAIEPLEGESFVFELGIDGWEAAARLRRWLLSTNHRIAPRALTLTMFFRLCMADQFVHGIGGARYDQVTDLLIQSRYGIEAPSFSVTTATLYFPDALGRERACLPCVKQEGHRLKHQLIGERKRELVAAIESLPRHSTERAQRFSEMRGELVAAAEMSDVLRKWRDRLAETEQQERQDEALFDRELFYAIQPRERLMDLIQRYADAVNR